MKTALTINQGRMAPCFAGVELRIVEAIPSATDDSALALGNAQVVSTRGWHPLGWGRELVRHNVEVLLCAGIDQSTWASILGHGIRVVPTTLGAADKVLSAWRDGALTAPRIWPPIPKACKRLGLERFGPGCGRRRFHGGTR